MATSFNFELIWEEVDKIPGYLSRAEGLSLYLSLKKSLPLPGNIIEIGAFCGRSTVLLGLVVQALAPGKKLITVDNFAKTTSDLFPKVNDPRSELLSNIDTAGLREVVNVVEDDSVSALRSVRDEMYCFAFLDSEHTAEQASAELDVLQPLISHGGVLAIHDYGNQHIDSSYTEFLRSRFISDFHCIEVKESDSRFSGNGILLVELP